MEILNVGVFSPERATGITTLSILLSLCLGEYQNQKVILTKIPSYDSDLTDYLGIETEFDSTRDLSQIVTLIRTNALKAEELSDYYIKVSENTSIFNSTMIDISKDDTKGVIPYLIDNVEAAYLICDIGDSIHEEYVQHLLPMFDFFICVTKQDLSSTKKINLFKQQDYYKKMEKQGLIYVINAFNKNICSTRSYAKSIGAVSRKVCKLTYNPWIQKMGMLRRLDEIFYYVQQNDFRLTDVYTDLATIQRTLLAQNGTVSRWK